MSGMLSVSGQVVLVLIESLPHYTDRYGLEGVILGYGMYNLFDESRHVTGNIYPGDKRITLCFFVRGKIYQASTDEVRAVLLGDQPTAVVTV